MTVVPEALAHAHYLLQQDMLGYLDNVEQLTNEVNEDDDQVILAVARDHVPRLVAAIRGVLSKHKVDVFGLCLGCPPTWTDRRFVRESWPCPVVQELHRFAKNPESVYDSVPMPGDRG